VDANGKATRVSFKMDGDRKCCASRQRGDDLMLDATPPVTKAMYNDSIRAAMMEEFSYKNAMQVHRLERSS
jgi:hypothetical protein